MVDIIFVTNKDKQENYHQLKNIKYSDDINIIYTGLNASASINRNHGLSRVTSDIFIMLDDDIYGFYHGWAEELIKPMLMDETIIITSARLLKPDGSFGFMMGDNKIQSPGVHEAKPSFYNKYKRLPTACLAIRKNDLIFDINFVTCGYEDTDYMNRINENYPDLKLVINNNCKLVHLNNMTKQGGKYFTHNKKYYLSKYPDDPEVKNQRDWTGQGGI